MYMHEANGFSIREQKKIIRHSSILEMFLQLLILLRINAPPWSSLQLLAFLSCSLFWCAAPSHPIPAALTKTGTEHCAGSPRSQLTQAACMIQLNAECLHKWENVYCHISKCGIFSWVLTFIAAASKWNVVWATSASDAYFRVREPVGRQITWGGFVWIFHDLIAQK